MKKVNLWLGILVMTLIFGMMVVGCGDGSTDDDSGPKSATYSSYDKSGNGYKLVVTKNPKKAAYNPQSGDGYVLTITDPSGKILGTSTGTVKDINGVTLTLKNENGEFKITITGNTITSVPETITMDGGGMFRPSPGALSPNKPAGNDTDDDDDDDITYTAKANDNTDTTAINFVFSEAVSGLTASNIAVANGTGSVTKGTLTGSGKNWSLGITVTAAGNVSVKITKNGIESGTKTVAVAKMDDIITYAIESNSGTNTTGINFMFNAAVSGLTANDITITNGTGSATKGTLTGSGKLWQLKVTVTTAGNISVKIAKSGIESGTKTLKVFTGLGGGSGDSSFNVGSYNEWKAACSTIAYADSNQSYTINVTGDFDVPGSPYTSTFGKVTGITVTITGNHTITVSDIGSLIVTNSGQTVNLKDVRLEGHSANKHCLVRVGGTFNMESGSISNNTSIQGGAVIVANSATFNMKGGSITGNTAEYGGGVDLFNSATFTMTGGTISGNTATKVGGGVYVGSSATFDLKDLNMVKSNTAQEKSSQANEICVAETGTLKINGSVAPNSLYDGTNYHKYK